MKKLVDIRYFLHWSNYFQYLLFRKSFPEIYQSDSEGWESSKDLRSNLGHLESELLFLSTLTGISIRNYSKKTETLTSPEMAEKSKCSFQSTSGGEAYLVKHRKLFWIWLNKIVEGNYLNVWFCWFETCFVGCLLNITLCIILF